MTTVIFRYWQKSIIALFPTIEADPHGNCLSYQHIGQHGAADYTGIVTNSRPATKDEYTPLLAELQSIGYADLSIRKRHYAIDNFPSTPQD